MMDITNQEAHRSGHQPSVGDSERGSTLKCAQVINLRLVTVKGVDISMDYIITTDQLTKKYKDFISVNHVSLHVRRGSIYGFLGPNGAGKSTTMKMLLGLAAPTSGSFTVDGKHFPGERREILKEIGSFIESPSYYANLTGRENLDIIRRILGLSADAVDDALELVGLAEFGGRLARKYSLGMKQRLGLAGALIGRPPILILDEPTNGLDPSGIHEIRGLVKSLPGLYDCSVLISSHMLSEIELIADDIGILNHGRLLFEGSLEKLRENASNMGFASDNLEEMFLTMIDQDNAARKQRAVI
jgi:ABC-type multidrug transport system ATPase subunit